MTSRLPVRLSPQVRLAVAAVLVITGVFAILDPVNVLYLVANLVVIAAGLLLAVESIDQLRARSSRTSVLR